MRTHSLEELFGEFYRYQYDGNLPEEPFDRLIAFVAEQTRNGSEDSTEKERKRDTMQLISYASKCRGKEEER